MRRGDSSLTNTEITTLLNQYSEKQQSKVGTFFEKLFETYFELGLSEISNAFITVICELHCVFHPCHSSKLSILLLPSYS